MANQASGTVAGQKPFWLARSTRTIFFFVVVLTLAGVYLALQGAHLGLSGNQFSARGHRRG